MDLANWNIWESLTFKTSGYHKNFDLLIKNENIITEYSGTVSLIRLNKKLAPLPIGEYSFSVWNLDLAKKIKANINKLIKTYGQDNIYVEIVDMIKNKKLQTMNYQKIVFIHSFILHPDYRKKEITEEFIESMHKGYYDDKNNDIGIIVFVKPVQDNKIDLEYYRDSRTVKLRETHVLSDYTELPAYDYYKIDDLLKKNDTEINEYKLFSVASKCGFSRINDSHLFIYSPDKITVRMDEKQKIIESMEEEFLKK